MAREMKNSGIEWIGEIPIDWVVVRTLYVFAMPITDGPHITPELYDNGIPFVSAEAVSFGNGKIDFAHIRGFITEEFYKECCKKYIPQINDIYMIKSGATTGKIAIVDTNDIFTIWSPLAVFRCNEKIMIHQFMFYSLQADYFQKQVEQGWTYGTQQNIGMRTLERLMLCCPSINEQQKIADYLDKKCAEIDSLSVDIQSQISILEDHKKSVITEAVTKGLNPDVEMKDSGIEWIGDIPKEWKVLRLKNIGDYRNGLTYSPLDLTDENKGTLVLRSSNVKNGEIVFEDNVYVSCSIRPELKVKQGDILICSRNGSRDLVGKNAIISDDIEASFGAFMMILRCTCPKYMHYVLNSAIFSYYLGSFFTSTINQLTGNNFGNMKIVFCNNEAEQNRIVKYLDKKCTEIEGTIVEKKKQLEVLEQYKKSLIYEYVTGKKEVIL